MHEGEECKAIYFCCMTHHVDAMRLQSRVIEEKNRSETMQSSTSTVSHEFRTPLATSIMFLENILQVTTDKHQRSTLEIVISQLNFLLSLVNDILDLK